MVNKEKTKKYMCSYQFLVWAFLLMRLQQCSDVKTNQSAEVCLLDKQEKESSQQAESQLKFVRLYYFMNRYLHAWSTVFHDG